MDRSELSEIRARLRAEATGEARSRSTPLLRSLRTLLAPAAPASPPKPAHPPPRRVGLRPSVIDEIDEEMFAPIPLEVSGRSAFGQRSEPAPPPAASVLMLAAPEPPAVEAPRWGAILANPLRAETAMAETPYHPEDFSDPAEGEAERLYAAAGLHPSEPVAAPPSLRRTFPPLRLAPSPEQELLGHLERVFLAEMAGIAARRL